MAKSAPTKSAPTPPARRPRWDVTYRTLSASEVDVPFSDRARPESPYRLALCTLLKPGCEDKILEFPRPQARFQLAKHARELEVRILFGERDGKLYVKLAKPIKVNDQILAYIGEKPRTKQEVDAMVEARRLDLDAASELQNLSAAGLIHLDGDSKWKITPKGKAKAN